MTVDEGAVVALGAEVDVASAGTWRFAWDFGDGTGLAADPRARLAFHAFDDDGDYYDVVVRVEDLEGRVATARARVRVGNVAPVVRGVERDGAAIEGAAVRFDLVDGPGGRTAFPRAAKAEVSGGFAHAVQRSPTGGSGSPNPVAGGAFGDWFLCVPRGKLSVEATVPAPPAATDDPPSSTYVTPRSPCASMRRSTWAARSATSCWSGGVRTAASRGCRPW